MAEYVQEQQALADPSAYAIEPTQGPETQALAKRPAPKRAAKKMSIDDLEQALKDMEAFKKKEEKEKKEYEKKKKQALQAEKKALGKALQKAAKSSNEREREVAKIKKNMEKNETEMEKQAAKKSLQRGKFEDGLEKLRRRQHETELALQSKYSEFGEARGRLEQIVNAAPWLSENGPDGTNDATSRGGLTPNSTFDAHNASAISAEEQEHQNELRAQTEQLRLRKQQLEEENDQLHAELEEVRNMASQAKAAAAEAERRENDIRVAEYVASAPRPASPMIAVSSRAASPVLSARGLSLPSRVIPNEVGRAGSPGGQRVPHNAAGFPTYMNGGLGGGAVAQQGSSFGMAMPSNGYRAASASAAYSGVPTAGFSGAFPVSSLPSAVPSAPAAVTMAPGMMAPGTVFPAPQQFVSAPSRIMTGPETSPLLRQPLSDPLLLGYGLSQANRGSSTSRSVQAAPVYSGLVTAPGVYNGFSNQPVETLVDRSASAFADPQRSVSAGFGIQGIDAKNAMVHLGPPSESTLFSAVAPASSTQQAQGSGVLATTQLAAGVPEGNRSTSAPAMAVGMDALVHQVTAKALREYREHHSGVAVAA